MEKLKLNRKRTVLLIYAVLALGVAAYAIAFLFGDPKLENRFDRSFVSAETSAIPGHFFFGGLALLLTPLQLSAKVRLRWRATHRFAGLLYAVAVLIAGVSALVIAPRAQGGMVSVVGFTTLSLLWMGSTALAWQRALVRDFTGHARWMYRSVALTSSAITLRIILGLGVPVAKLPLDLVYSTAAWAAWIINLAVCESLFVRRADRR
ncbi:MAG: DUF2306 domain-containing protein [Pseudomonadota bacterium]